MSIDPRLGQAQAHIDAGFPERAVPTLQRLVQGQPRSPQIAELLAIALLRTGDLARAEYYQRRATELAPMLPGYLVNLGHILVTLSRHAEALDVLGRAIALDPSFVPARVAQAGAFLMAQRFASAARQAAEALRVDPANSQASLTHAIALRNLGDAPAAMASLKNAAARHPDDIAIASGLAYVSNYPSGVSPADSRRLHEAFGTLLRREDVRIIDPPVRSTDPHRRIRVGFVSADLRSHPVAHFLVPLLRHLDRERFHITCYSSTLSPDATSEMLRSMTQLWRPVQTLSPFEVASLMSHDAIDIVIDLGGLTGGNSLAALRHQPAPIQATWLGYPATTGLSAMGFRFVDSHTDPSPDSDGHCTERLVRLDPCLLCYEPPAGAPDVAVDGTPRDSIAFGSFNTLQKVSNEVLSLWGRILSNIPGSALILKNTSLGEPEVREATTARAARAGIPIERLRLLEPTVGVREHLAAYRDIDIALDTFPYHGTTTTCESLWMGVPVVTLAGDRHASRVGVSLLNAAGLRDLVASTSDEYMAIATGLARDSARLATLRRGLRPQVRDSSLCDALAFADRFGEALKSLWQDRCSAQPR